MGLEPVYRGILAVDIERFSRAEWTDPTRARQRGRLHRLLDHALAHTHIAASQTHRGDTGDGALLLVAAEVPTTRLLHPLTLAFVDELAADNRVAPATERLRLRLVVHAGEVIADPYGHTGETLNLAARLLDAQAGRAILAGVLEVDAVLLVSEQVYQGVVKHAYPSIDPAGYQPVWVTEKETSTRAWAHLPRLAHQPDLARLHRVPVAPRHGPPTQAIPHELPGDIAAFTGRQDEVAQLHRLLAAIGERVGGGTMVISAIDGMGGVGKSALAIHAAHHLTDAGAYPDGQLYVNLQGTTPGLAPLDPRDALGRMLRALGADPAQIPTEVEEAACRFRSLAAERRLLVLLDNAHGPQQVRPLLPASPTCAVLVTSRRVLATLDGAHPLHLGLLTSKQALELLGRIAGPERITAEPEAAAEVVRWCGYLPLAIRLAGARLAARPTWPVRELANRLADATGRLDELASEGLAVRATFDISLEALQHSPEPIDQAAAQAFGLLSLPDGPNLDAAAAARLLDQPDPTTETLLERLVDAQLLETPYPGRYQFHDLVRLYARHHTAAQHPKTEQLAALARLFGFHTATAWHTFGLLWPGEANRRLATVDPRWTHGGRQFADASAALGWLEAERTNLLAAITQAATSAPEIPAELAGQLSRGLYGFFEVRGYLQDGVQANQTTLALARRTGDRAGQAHAHIDLGILSMLLGRYQEAIASLQDSLTLFEELGDRTSQAASLNGLGSASWRLGRYQEAITCYQDSLTISRELGDRSSQTISLTNLGVVYERLGRHQEAITSLQDSLTLFQELGDRRGQAISLTNLGRVYLLMGRHQDAITSLQDSLTLSRELGDRRAQASNLNSLGVVYQRLGRYQDAITTLQDSLTINRGLDDRHGQAEALRDLGDALLAVGRSQQTHEVWQEALEICEALRIPEAGEVRARLAAIAPETAEPASDG